MTRGLSRAAVGIVLALAFLITAGGVASAEPIGRIDVVPAEGSISIVLTATDSAADATGTTPPKVDLSSVEVEIRPDSGGAPRVLQDITRRLTSGEKRTTQSVMLVIDESGSMEKPDIELARSSVREFVQQLPTGVKVGLLAFATDVRRLSRLTSNHQQVLERVAKIGEDDSGAPSRKYTNLYDAIVRAADELPEKGTGAASIVLLSDGRSDLADDSRKGDATPAIKAVRAKGIPVVAAGLGDSDRLDEAALKELRDAVKGGNYVRAAKNSDQLQEIFQTNAEVISNRVIIDANIPPELLGLPGTVTVRATAGSTPIEDEQRAALGIRSSSPKPTAMNAAPQLIAADGRQGLISLPVLLSGLVALFLALCVIAGSALGLVGRTESQQTRILRRLSVYTIGGRQPQQVSTEVTTTRLGDNVLARSAVDLVGKVVRRGRFDVSVDRRLDAAGLPLRTAEWTLLHIATAVLTALLLLAISGGRVLAMLLGLLIGTAAPWIFLSIRRSRRERAFMAQLPDTLQLLAGSLQAGYSLPQAMDSVVREASPPISTEFGRALIEARLGMPAEEALDAISVRMGSRDFSWIVMAIRIQREVGGNLAELLGSVAGTLRERERLRRHVSALSAEGRLSGWILGLLPVVFVTYLAVANPEYLGQLNNLKGALLLSMAGILLAVGVFWMTRVIRVEV